MWLQIASVLRRLGTDLKRLYIFLINFYLYKNNLLLTTITFFICKYLLLPGQINKFEESK